MNKNKEELFDLYDLHNTGEKTKEELFDDYNYIENYNDDIGYYIKDELGYEDNNHIDNIEISGDKVHVAGIFRRDEVEDFEQYEEDGFPDDDDDIFIEKKDLEEWLKKQQTFINFMNSDED